MQLSVTCAFVFFLSVFAAADANEEVDQNHALRSAAAAGNVQEVWDWIDHGADVNSGSPSGWTALVYATDRSHPAVIEALLHAGADPNIAENDGWSPLMFAAVKGDLQSCRLLIQAGADLEHVSKNDWTPLKAAQRGKNPDAGAFMEGEIAKSNELKVDNVGLGRDFLQAVKDSDMFRAREMLDRGIDPNALSPNGWTGVTYASANGNVEMIRLLIGYGTDINKADKDGWTPLMFAAFQGNLDVVLLLLEHGADVLARNMGNTGALIMASNYAKHKNDDRVKRAIAEAGMAQALRREDLPSVIEMLEVGDVDINYQDPKPSSAKWTPLILATSKRDLASVSSLLNRGADPNIAEADGWMPLFFAVFANDAQLCKIILESGADIRHRLRNGKSAVDVAHERKNADVIRILTEHEERERRALEESKTADPVKEVLPNAVETAASEEEKRQEKLQREQQARDKQQQAREQHERDKQQQAREQHEREEKARRRRQQEQPKEEYIEEHVRYEDVAVAEPEGLVDKVMSFLGF